eukprot:3838-Eustigmatos_ZCMA.PRE.1
MPWWSLPSGVRAASSASSRSPSGPSTPCSSSPYVPIFLLRRILEGVIGRRPLTHLLAARAHTLTVPM